MARNSSSGLSGPVSLKGKPRQPRVFFAQGFSKKENSSGGKIQ
jgi:hypothetical protein